MAEGVRVICVSHLTGAEGEAVARGVADRLGFRYLDDEIIEKAAEWIELDPSAVAEVERRKSLTARIGAAIRADPLPSRPDAAAQSRSVLETRERPSDEDLRALIRDVIRETAGEGGIVIASHAAAMVLADRGDTFRVLVTASPKTRADKIAAARDLDPQRAEKVVVQEDAARADYLKRFHNVERELPIHYDLIVNTDRLEPEQGADLIAHAAR